MSDQGEVLIALLNNKRDFSIVHDRHWYRIPVSSAHKWLKNRWPPQWIAFYQTKVFGAEAYSISYYTKVIRVRKVYRQQLFPDEMPNRKSNRQYYQLILNPLQKLPKPIFSRRRRRIIFIPTTWYKFIRAAEINDLYDESPLEDRLWAEFKRHNILAERQEFVKVDKQNYALDFAVYCSEAKIDIETDGDSYHAKKTAEDNRRNNALAAAGWKVLRFTTQQVQEQMESYCIRNITETINHAGGVDEGKMVARKIDLKTNGVHQLSLFDDL
ncbi:MAG: DUF559 domain-containing protein [Candidatus Electrothrix sp. Rat3]|nr:DUF559 domain-containing protein [Candidatus Electrothrix rattekaaiensis]